MPDPQVPAGNTFLIRAMRAKVNKSILTVPTMHPTDNNGFLEGYGKLCVLNTEC